MAVDSSGNVFVVYSSNAVVKLSPNGTVLATYSAGLNGLSDVTLDSLGNLYILSNGYGYGSVVRLLPNGTQIQPVFTTSNPGLTTASGVAVDFMGNVYVADLANNRLVKFFPNASYVVLYTALNSPSDVVMGLANDLYILDAGENLIVHLSLNGTRLNVIPFTKTLNSYPVGFAVPTMTIDTLGNLFVADEANGRILAFIIPPPSSTSGVSSSTNPLSMSSIPPSSSTSPLQISSRPSSPSSTSSALVNVPPALISSSSSTPSVSPPLPSTPTTASGSLCIILYSLPGNVDYPWSVATSLNVVYNSTAVTTSAGTSIALLNVTGSRTYTNRFGVSFTTPLTLSTATPSLLYLNSSAVLDTVGITLQLDSAIQLPGSGPHTSYPSVHLYYTANGLVEGGSSLIDEQGVAFQSSIAGVSSLSIGAANTNSLAVNYAQCQAPLTFTNGLRTPVQPSSSNGGVHLEYGYTISDGLTYIVSANLSITTTSAFANTRDGLGNNYQTVTSITGNRLYIYLPTGETLTSAIIGISNITADQRFYPYALLSSAPGIYTVNTAPFLDVEGLVFNVNPAIPTNGQPVNTATATTVSIFINSTSSTATLTESPTLSYPLSSLQTQSYTIL